MITRTFTVGDRLIPLKAKLYRPGGNPVVLDGGDEMSFRMVAANGTVKIDNRQVTVLNSGNSVSHTPAEVQYDWQLTDVDTAGTYTGWFIRQSGGKPEHFPVQDPDNPELQIIFKADA